MKKILLIDDSDTYTWCLQKYLQHRGYPVKTACTLKEARTAELLNTLIEKITVHEAVKGEDGSREQEVEIYYRFIGKID